ncbi:MAG: hypothetical protein U0457_18365 [Candidatus Sericytochromatia bacterium]
MKIRRFLPFVVASIIITSGCNNATNLLPSNNNGNTNTQNTSPSVETVNTPVGEFKFKKVSTDKVAEYNSLISQNIQNQNTQNNKALASGASGKESMADSAVNVATSPAIAPMPAPSSAPSSGGAGVSYSAPAIAVAPPMDMARSSFPVSYFPYPGAFEEYTVVDFEEARSNGFVGTYAEIVSKIIKPTIKNLASDARMTYSSGNLDKDGLNKNQPQPTANPNQPQPYVTAMPYYYGYNNFQWSFTFVSSAKKEVYNFYISSNETLILRQKWGVKEINLDNIKIDSSDAIKLVTNAIKNKDFKSEQDKTLMNTVPYYSPNSELLYDIPKDKDLSWNLYMELGEKGKVYWNVNMNINYYTPITYDVPVPAGSAYAGSVGYSSGSSVAVDAGSPTYIKPTAAPRIDYYYSGAYARIDAETGSILIFNRPTRTRQEVYPYYSPYPVYPVGATPDIAIATAVPSASPSPTVTSMPAEVKPTAVVSK